MGSHTLSPPQGSDLAMVLADGCGQPKGGFPKPSSLNGATLWYLLNLYNSVICCQYSFLPITSLLPVLQPMKKISVVCKETLCVYTCVYFGGKKTVSVNLFFQLKVCLVARETLFSPCINLGRKSLLCSEQKWQRVQWELGANTLTALCPRFTSLGWKHDNF